MMLKPLWGKTLITLLRLYAVIWLFILLIRALFSEDIGAIGWLNHGIYWLLALSLASFVLSALVEKKHYYTLLHVPPILLWLSWTLPLFMTIPTPADSQTITVASYNFNMLWQHLAKHEQVIELLDADIIGFQEYDNFKETQAWLDALYPYTYKESGTAIASRYPIRDIGREIVDFVVVEYAKPNRPARQYATAIRAVVEIDGQAVSVYNLHPRRPNIDLFAYDAREREQTIEVVQAHLATDPNPVILLCDCNFTPQSRAYTRLAAHLTDTWQVRGVGLGATVPVFGQIPLLRVDYIWVSTDFSVLAAPYPLPTASDHLPVMSIISLHTS